MDRNTEGDTPLAVPTDPLELARIEARNGLRQFDAAMNWVQRLVGTNEPLNLNTVNLCELNHLATEGTSLTAGLIRNGKVTIRGSDHLPPPCGVVPGLVEQMCLYVNENWSTSSAVHLAAYLLWQVNWIHPFGDGNGRTARMISYVALCVRLGFRLPGTETIPDQISRDKQPYYQALEAADAALIRGVLDVTVLEVYLGELLAKQLVSIHQIATGS